MSFETIIHVCIYEIKGEFADKLIHILEVNETNTIIFLSDLAKEIYKLELLKVDVIYLCTMKVQNVKGVFIFKIFSDTVLFSLSGLTNNFRIININSYTWQRSCYGKK